MSTKNSTGDNLVASVRKTKRAAATQTKSTKKKVVKKSVQRPLQKSTPENKIKTVKEQLIDMFQSGARVWPD